MNSHLHLRIEVYSIDRFIYFYLTRFNVSSFLRNLLFLSFIAWFLIVNLLDFQLYLHTKYSFLLVHLAHFHIFFSICSAFLLTLISSISSLTLSISFLLFCIGINDLCSGYSSIKTSACPFTISVVDATISKYQATTLFSILISTSICMFLQIFLYLSVFYLTTYAIIIQTMLTVEDESLISTRMLWWFSRFTIRTYETTIMWPSGFSSLLIIIRFGIFLLFILVLLINFCSIIEAIIMFSLMKLALDWFRNTYFWILISILMLL